MSTDDRDRPVPWAPPDNVLPGATELTVVLARRSDVVVALTGVQVYPGGFLAQLWLLERGSGARHRGRPASNVPFGPATLRIGYSDGRTGAALVPTGPWPAGPAERIRTSNSESIPDES